MINCETLGMYRFGDCEVDPARREIRKGGVAVHLEPQAFDLLVHLIDQRDRVVTKMELLDGVWGHRFVSEANLTTRIKEIRRAIGDDGVAQHTIRNLRGRGYRFVADLADPDGWQRHASPVQLVGREDDEAAVRAALGSQPLVTITGPGGVGKTALARRVVADPAVPGLDGGHFVELGSLEMGGDVLSAVALALSVAVDTARPTTTIAAIGRLDALVVLDNCEHVTESVAVLIERLLAQPDRVVRVLATSRSRLGVGGEWVHTLAPLEPASALTLFGLRATAARRGWDLGTTDQSRVDAVLAGLDRLPLTIEMAAARLGSMSFDDIEDALVTGAPVLQVSHRGSGHRHRSLGSLVAWSAGLLTDEQRRVFEDCSVFAGTFTVDDAAAVLDTGSTTALQLAELVDRSLLAAELTAPSARYQMLRTIRSAAAEGLEASGRADAVRARHAAHFSAVAADADRRIRCSDELSGRRSMAEIAPELRVAHRWARDHDPALADAMCTTLFLFSYSSFWNEPTEWAHALLASDPSVPTPGAYLLVAGAAANRGDLADATRHARAALSCPDRHVRATAWEIVADVAIYSGDYDLTIEATGALRDLATGLDDPHLQVIAVVDRALAEAFLGEPRDGLVLLDEVDTSRCSPSDAGWLIYTRGELLSALGDSAAIDAYTSAIELADDVGNHFVGSVAAMSLATELVRTGERDRALDVYAECLRGYLRHGNLAHALTALRNLIEPLHDSGDTHTAVTLAAVTTADGRRVSYGAEADRMPAVIERIEHSVHSDEFERWWSAGAGLGLDEAIRLAADSLDHREPPTSAR